MAAATKPTTIYRILILPGDHAGPEVMHEALKVLNVVHDHVRATKGVALELDHDIIGGVSIDTEGVPVTDRVLEKAKRSDAVLFGSVGGPEWGTKYPNPESGLLRMRHHIGAFANIRPCTIYSRSLIPFSPLKPSVVEGTNFIILRENCGGAYFGAKVERDDYASDTWEYSTHEIERCARVAAALARTMSAREGTTGQRRSQPPAATVWSADKANVLASGRLWRRVTTRIFEREFPDVPLRHQLADSLSMLMVKCPTMFNGVILTDNTFGDMLSDQAGGVVGTLGVLPSASLCGVPGVPAGGGGGGTETVTTTAIAKCNGIYEPVHGSAPDIAGQQKVNPVAQILSLAMLLRYSLGLEDEADAVERAVQRTLDGKDIGGLEVRTGDLGGKATTAEVGDAVVEVLKELLSSKDGVEVKQNGISH